MRRIVSLVARTTEHADAVDFPGARRCLSVPVPCVGLEPPAAVGASHPFVHVVSHGDGRVGEGHYQTRYGRR